MTREEQIIDKAKNKFSDDQIYPISKVYAFVDGAKWADENPRFSKEEFIEKACEWLEQHVNDDKYYSCIGEETLIPYLIEDFKKAMEK